MPSCRMEFPKILDTDSAVKRCTKCGEEKPATFEFFARNAVRGTVYLRSHCKACRAADKQQWRAEDPARARAYDRQFAARKRQNSLARYYANREACLSRARDAYRSNPERFRAKTANGRAGKVGAVGLLVGDDIRQAYARQGGICFYCEADLQGGFDIDHMTPLSRGGPNEPSNICCACTHCNRTKSDATADEFIAKRAS